MVVFPPFFFSCSKFVSKQWLEFYCYSPPRIPNYTPRLTDGFCTTERTVSPASNNFHPLYKYNQCFLKLIRTKNQTTLKATRILRTAHDLANAYLILNRFIQFVSLLYGESTTDAGINSARGDLEDI